MRTRLLHLRAVTAVAAGCLAALLPVSAVQAQPGPAAGTSELQAALDGIVAAGGSGAAAVVQDGHRTVRLTAGHAGLDPLRPMSSRAQTRVGSITKTFVATAALKLVAQGRLRLDDSVERWLPGLLPGGSTITVRMLLSQTSGVFNFTEDPDVQRGIFTNTFDPTPRQLVAVANAHPPTFPPGTGWYYSNTGYIVIGLILEKVTGQPLARILDRQVIQPLGLRNTYLSAGQWTGRHLSGYLPPALIGNADYVDTTDWTLSWAWAAGGIVSTSDDLATFYQALLGGRVLPPRMLREMTTTREVTPEFRYGLGLYTLKSACGVFWGHDGGLPGYITVAATDRTGTRSAILLLPTYPDERIAATLPPAIDAAVCQMYSRPLPPSAAQPGAAARRSAPPALLDPLAGLLPQLRR